MFLLACPPSYSLVRSRVLGNYFNKGGWSLKHIPLSRGKFAIVDDEDEAAKELHGEFAYQNFKEEQCAR